MSFLWPSGKYAEKGTRAPFKAAANATETVTLLVIQSDKYDWGEIFASCHLQDGRRLRVIQTGWDRLLVHADSPAMSPRTSALVHIRNDDGKSQTIQPDFVLVRNEVRETNHTNDFRTVLFGLMYASIPAVNSLESIYNFLERPIVQAELHKIQKRLGVSKFPVIAQSYYSSFSTMMYGNRFPAVVKVGHAHVGAGKMRVQDHHVWEDVRSIVCVTDGKYCTAEPFVNGDYDIRIQKIGNHYRVFRLRSTSGNWKTNTGCAIIEEIELTSTYKEWADECSKIFGGLQICTVDAIHDLETGKEYILEVNGTSSGLLPDHADEDNRHIRDLVLEKMNDVLVG